MKIICINKFEFEPATKTMEFVGQEFYANKTDFKRGLAGLREFYADECLSVVIIDTDKDKKTTWKSLHHMSYGLHELEYIPELM